MAVLPAFQPAFEAAVKQFIPEIRVDFISGGATRTESVRN